MNKSKTPYDVKVDSTLLHHNQDIYKHFEKGYIYTVEAEGKLSDGNEIVAVRNNENVRQYLPKIYFIKI